MVGPVNSIRRLMIRIAQWISRAFLAEKEGLVCEDGGVAADVEGVVVLTHCYGLLDTIMARGGRKYIRT